ncbi:cation:proton antiporter [Nocardioides guangzhouensis]|uniref:Cation:proton antiporter n=1 Tax=Nocardioides guangzhouensis TaxID=2497878 RepID=A0A4Q4Z1Y4_9ACTN|nr:cation:proton antiporter [Nocardioides guangzhouensis]RYP81613.1 cation:proton antiporter [Nocardioides guangzhouensis]
MPDTVTSLFWISLVGVVAPLIAGLVPRKLLPEVVLLLGFGMLIGEYGLDLAAKDDGVTTLSQLGLAMLFLLAGFEIDPAELAGREGRRALRTWIGSLSFAFVLVVVLNVASERDLEITVAIALTSTALGTLLPILKDGGLLERRVGQHVLRHGAYGELGPVVAMALFLGTRGTLQSLLVLLAFALVTVLLALPSHRLRESTGRVLHVLRAGAETTGQTTVRLTMLLLVTLGAVATAFHLDIVLAAFAAGFILRLAIPDGNEHLEARLEGIAFGLLIPIFFVTSGMGIDPDAIVSRPGAFVAVIAGILLARGGPVLLVTLRGRAGSGMSVREAGSVALFAATGLPIIVAVTSVAVAAGEMSSDNASLLVAGGAATVLLCPLAATLVLGRAGREPTTDETAPA